MKTLETFINRYLAWFTTNGNKMHRIEQYRPKRSNQPLTLQQIENGNEYLGRVKDVIDSDKNEQKHLTALIQFYHLSVASCGYCEFVDDAIDDKMYELLDLDRY